MSSMNELLQASGQEPRGKKEHEQTFLKRLTIACNDLTDEAWAGLSVEAQEWLNDAAAKYDAKEPIASLPEAPEAESAPEAEVADADAGDDADADEESDDNADDEADEEEEHAEADDDDADEEPAAAPVAPPKPAKMSNGSKNDKKSDAAPPKAPKKAATAATGTDKRGGSGRVCELLIGDINLTKEEIKAKLDAEGFKISDITLNATFYNVKSIIRQLSDSGQLKKKVNA